MWHGACGVGIEFPCGGSPSLSVIGNMRSIDVQYKSIEGKSVTAERKLHDWSSVCTQWHPSMVSVSDVYQWSLSVTSISDVSVCQRCVSVSAMCQCVSDVSVCQRCVSVSAMCQCVGDVCQYRPIQQIWHFWTVCSSLCNGNALGGCPVTVESHKRRPL